MQGGGGGNIFTGVDLRRPRGYPSATSPASQPPLNCPRCDSTNTKFCYYNNYNLSQPRHFCKACRRYWTKGGVLRNVPVGGGCRKAKRSSGAKSSSSPSSGKEKKRTATCLSTSDTSTITAIDAANPSPSPPNALFAETCGVLEFSFADPLNMPFVNEPKEVLEMEPEDLPPSVLDQTAGVDFQAITGLDWPGSIDLTSTVDSVSYWNPSHWSDNMADPSLYLP